MGSVVTITNRKKKTNKKTLIAFGGTTEAAATLIPVTATGPDIWFPHTVSKQGLFD